MANANLLSKDIQQSKQKQQKKNFTLVTQEELDQDFDSSRVFSKSVVEQIPGDEMVDEHVFANVRIFFTGEESNNYKWTDSGLIGWLKIVQIIYPNLKDKLVTIPPIVHLRLLNVLGEIMLEFELPINFQFELFQKANLIAIGAEKGHWVGFHFTNSKDLTEFNNLLKKFLKALEVNEKQFVKLQQAAKRIIEEEQLQELSDTISPDDLLSMDPVKQAEAMRKLLILTGLNVETDFQNEDLMGVLKSIVENFDMNAPIEEDAAVFNMRLLHNQGKIERRESKHVRRQALQTKKENANLKTYEENEKKYISQEQIRASKIENSQKLQQEMDRIQRENEIYKKKLKEQQDREFAKKLSSKELADLEWRKTEIKLEKKRAQRLLQQKKTVVEQKNGELEQVEQNAPSKSFVDQRDSDYKLPSFGLASEVKQTDQTSIFCEPCSVKFASMQKKCSNCGELVGIGRYCQWCGLKLEIDKLQQSVEDSTHEIENINFDITLRSSNLLIESSQSKVQEDSEIKQLQPRIVLNGHRGPPAPPVRAPPARVPPAPPARVPTAPPARVPTAPPARVPTAPSARGLSARVPSAPPARGRPVILVPVNQSTQENNSFSEQLQRQQLKLVSSKSTSDSQSDMYTDKATIVGKIADAVRQQEQEILASGAKALVPIKSVELRKSQSSGQFLLQVREAQIVKHANTSQQLSFEDQLRFASQLLKPVQSKASQKISQRVLEEQEKQKQSLDFLSMKNRKVAQLASMLQIAIANNRIINKKRKNNSSSESESQSSPSDSSDTDE